MKATHALLVVVMLAGCGPSEKDVAEAAWKTSMLEVSRIGEDASERSCKRAMNEGRALSKECDELRDARNSVASHEHDLKEFCSKNMAACEKAKALSSMVAR